MWYIRHQGCALFCGGGRIHFVLRAQVSGEQLLVQVFEARHPRTLDVPVGRHQVQGLVLVTDDHGETLVLLQGHNGQLCGTLTAECRKQSHGKHNEINYAYK